jgi:hypothetical protein
MKRQYSLAIDVSKRRLGCKLSDLLWNTWDREASDPRDKDFATIGIANGDTGYESGIKVDYSNYMQRVFTEAAATIIEK